MIRRGLLIAASVLIGTLVAFSVRVYPEQVVERSAWGPTPGNLSEHYQRGKCSLGDVLTQGYEFRPVVLDAEIVYTRKPGWIYLYLLIFPACVAVAGVFFVCLSRLVRKFVSSLKFLLTSRLGVGLLAYAAISVLAHLLYYYHIWAGGMNQLPYWFVPLYGWANGALMYITLPCSLINQAVLYGLNALNQFAYYHTSPHLAYPGVDPIRRILGGVYPRTPVLWEFLNAAILLCLWMLVLPALVKCFPRIKSFLRDDSSSRNSPQ